MNRVHKTSTNVCPLIGVGMYETFLDPRELFCNDEREAEEDGMEETSFDMDKYVRDIGKRAAKVLGDFTDCITEGGYGIVSIKSDCGIDHPNYHGRVAYNFGTDELHLDIEVVPNFVEVAKGHLEDWRGDSRVEKYIKDNWKSRDGFISFMPESIDEFIGQLDKDYDPAGDRWGDLLVGGYCALCAVVSNYPNDHFMRYDGRGADCGLDPVFEELMEAVQDMRYEDYATLEKAERA